MANVPPYEDDDDDIPDVDRSTDLLGSHDKLALEAASHGRKRDGRRDDGIFDRDARVHGESHFYTRATILTVWASCTCHY